MSERVPRSKRTSEPEIPQAPCQCNPPCQSLKSRIPSRRKSTEDAAGKSNANQNSNGNCNKQNRPGVTCSCSYNQCSHVLSCCCVDDLDPIQEERGQAEKPNDAGASGTPGGEEDPCGEFFELMRCTMEEAVKKTINSCLSCQFTALFEKLDTVCSQMQRTDCILSRIYSDLNEKIAYYGDRNAQQFQYLCVRMENDRCFFQQQQDYLIKALGRGGDTDMEKRLSCGKEDGAEEDVATDTAPEDDGKTANQAKKGDAQRKGDGKNAPAPSKSK